MFVSTNGAGQCRPPSLCGREVASAEDNAVA